MHICVSRRIQVCDMGWLRVVGSLQLQVSFAKEPYKKDDILQKRPTILQNLLSEATPQQSRGRLDEDLSHSQVSKTSRGVNLVVDFSHFFVFQGLFE